MAVKTSQNDKDAMNRPDPLAGSEPPSFPVFSLPARRSSAWVTETDPEQARAWLATLSLADSTDAAQQLYRALYTLNRMEVGVEDRLAIMELYREPAALQTVRLRAHFAHLALPLKPRLKQLADFLRQLQLEMAHGYKHILEAMRAERRPWESEVFLFALERSIRCLGEALLSSYQVYMPAPAGVWREIHGLYRYAEQHDVQQRPVEPELREGGSVARAYLQVLMLGLCGPYQLPQNECHQVNAFLARWSHKAGIHAGLDNIDPVGHFLLDFDADHPAVPFPRDVPVHAASSLRAVNAVELARVAHQFIMRLQKGEPPRHLDLGFECIGSACSETLRRMLRFWGLASRRHFSRRRVRQPLSLCVGINAMHFFASGQQPFTQLRAAESADAEYPVPDSGALEAEARETATRPPVLPEIYRVDSRWQVRDESAGGLSLMRQGDVGLPVRIGDLLGIHNPEMDCWRVGVVRWLRSNDSQHIEAGVEMLGPSAHPLAVRYTDSSPSLSMQALMLPPVEVLHQPPTLLLPPGMVRPGLGLELMDDDQPARRVRILRVVERTNAFAQVVVADEAR
jgi:hypothetical protein